MTGVETGPDRVSPPRSRATAAPPGVDLAALLALVAKGDQAAFEAVYDRVCAPVFGTVRRVVRDPGLSEEVTQEVFVEVWWAASRFDAGKGSPMAWVPRSRTGVRWTGSGPSSARRSGTGGPRHR